MLSTSSPQRPLWRGLAVALPAALAFAVLAPFALDENSVVYEIDREVAQTMRDFSQKEHYFGLGMIALTVIGSVPVMTTIAVLGGAWQYIRRQRIRGAAWILIPLFGALLNLVLKVSLDRTRPPLDSRDPFVTETNQSFPSGHAMGAMIGWGVVGYMLLPEVKGRWKRGLLVTGLALLSAGIGLSRVYLRAHWLSDVMGGFVIGGAWLALCLGITEMLRLKKLNQSEAPR